MSAEKRSVPRSRTFSYLRKHYTQEFSLSSLAGKISGHSFASASTLRSTSSASRPWSRVSRKVWKDSTLSDAYQAVKTAWPVPIIEAIFLPEFLIDNLKQKEYEVINIIAKGAFGKVYRVLHKESQEYQAMKVMSKSKVLKDDCVNQVKDEVKIQLMCGHHPFIIKSPQYWQNKKKLFIVNEYIDGGDMFEMLQRYGPLPEELVQIYVAELASAIDFLHNAGVIYRDLKPENILLDSDGHAILIDFGLSKWLKYNARTYTLCGTLQYMAPEIFTLNGYGHAVDWWSLGVLTFYLFRKKYPAGGNSRSAGRLEEEDTSGLPPAGLDLLRRLLAPDPASRLTSLRLLQQLAFFTGFDLSRVKARQVRPKDLLEKHFPNGPKNIIMAGTDVVFFDVNLTPLIV